MLRWHLFSRDAQNLRNRNRAIRTTLLALLPQYARSRNRGTRRQGYCCVGNKSATVRQNYAIGVAEIVLGKVEIVFWVAEMVFWEVWRMM